MLGVQKLRVHARIGPRTISIRHRVVDRETRNGTVGNLKIAKGCFREGERERGGKKDGGQVKTVSLPGWKKVLASGTK